MRIISILENADLPFEIIHFDNRLKIIDGIQVDNYNHDEDFILQKVIVNQTELDLQILGTYPNYLDFFNSPYYTDDRKLFAMRNSLLETEVSFVLKKFSSDFDYCIVYNADLWFAKSWDLSWLQESGIVISDQNPGYGLTNGFYSGPIDAVSGLLDSFPTLAETAKIDFEGILLRISEMKGIHVAAVPFRFLKIRATQEPAYRDFPFWSKIKRIEHDYFLRAAIPIRMRFFHFFYRIPQDSMMSVWRKLKSWMRQ